MSKNKTIDIVKVTPVNQVFSITWMLGARCNFDCMYCDSEYHNSTDTHHTLEELKDYWNDIYKNTCHRNLKYKISFGGGEVTTNKDFLPFAIWLKEQFGDKIDKLLLTTNGSAGLQYYKNLLVAIDNISFSVHTEHINEKKFFNTVVELHKEISIDKFLHVNIMNEFWNSDRIPKYEKILKDNGISYSINEINYSTQTRKIPIFKGKLNLED